MLSTSDHYRFGAVRCGIEDSKETSPEQQSGAKLDVNPIVTDRLGENSQEISRGIEQMSQPV